MGKEPPEEFPNRDGMLDEGPGELYNFCRENMPYEVYDLGMVMNDQGESFEDIANMIERDW